MKNEFGRNTWGRKGVAAIPAYSSRVGVGGPLRFSENALMLMEFRSPLLFAIKNREGVNPPINRNDIKTIISKANDKRLANRSPNLNV